MRSRFVLAAALAAASATLPVAAQNYPSKTLRIVVAFPAGGPLDIVARHVSVRLAETMGQPVIVDNRAGANGLIGTAHVARSASDGYTMNFGLTSALVIKGAVPAVSDLVGGQLHGMFADVPVLHGHVVTGRLRPIVVASQKRSPVLPDVPTTVEAGYPAVQAVNWYGILVPAKTPRDVVQRLHEGIVKALAHPDLREKLAALGAEITTSDPDRFQAFLRDELQRWGRIARESGAKIE